PYHYGGSNGWLTEGALATRFFRRLGASNLNRTFCAAASTPATHGLYGVVPVIDRARAAGAKLVVVDPRRTPLARRADLHLAIRPGTDVPVALAVIHALFARGHADRGFLDRHAAEVDELRIRAAKWTIADAAAVAGVEPRELDRFVDLYARTTPAVIRVGWGL